MISQLKRRAFQEKEPTTLTQALTVVGHANLDVDAAVSALLMVKLLRHQGIDAVFKWTDAEIEIETYQCLLSLGYDLQLYKGETTTEELLVLVDHHETTLPGRVLACVDHHPTNKQLDYLYYKNEPASACAKHVLALMEECGVPISPQDLALILHAVFFDTCSLRSTKALPGEKEWCLAQIKAHNFDYQDLEQKGLCLNDLSLPVSVLVENGSKTYQYGPHQVKSSYLQIFGGCSIESELLAEILKRVQASDISLWVFLLVDFDANKTQEYQVSRLGVSRHVHEFIASRGCDIMPNIEAKFTS